MSDFSGICRDCGAITKTQYEQTAGLCQSCGEREYGDPNEMPTCYRCGDELSPNGTCYECGADNEHPAITAFREPDCDQCGGPTREGFCNHCQA